MVRSECLFAGTESLEMRSPDQSKNKALVGMTSCALGIEWCSLKTL